MFPPSSSSFQAPSRTSSPAPGIEFEDRGQHKLKGISEAWHLFKVVEAQRSCARGLGVSRAAAPAAIAMTSQGTARGRFQRAINRRHLLAAEMAAREMGGLSLADALLLCELLANADPQRYERAALRWLERFMVPARQGSFVDPRRARLLLRRSVRC